MIYCLKCDSLAEWLRRWPAKPLCIARIGSNPIAVDINDNISVREEHKKVTVFVARSDEDKKNKKVKESIENTQTTDNNLYLHSKYKLRHKTQENLKNAAK